MKRQDRKRKLWKGTLGDLLELAKTDKEIKESLFANAARRVYNAVLACGGVEEGKALDGEKINIYPYFQEKIYGKEKYISHVMSKIRIAGGGAEVGRNLFILVGPPGGAKSTIVQMLREALEGTTAYMIKDCPVLENPFKVIPKDERQKLAEELGIKRAPGGYHCPWCDKHYKEIVENNWKELPVEEFVFSERKGLGIAVIGTAQNPQDVDISELVGSQSLPKAMKFEESDPDSWNFRKGALFKAQGGLLEIIEVLKLKAEFHKTFDTVCQEAKIDIPGIGQVTGLDLLIIGHTNESEYKKFEVQEGGEWLRRRVTRIGVPHVLDYKAEEKIQKKLVEHTNFQKLHKSPYTFELLGRLGVLSRFVEHEKIDPLDKMAMYAGETAEEKPDMKVEELAKHGQGKNEGMTGIDATILSKMLFDALEKRKDCLFCIDLIKEIETFVHEKYDATVKDRSQEVNEMIPDWLIDLKTFYTEKLKKDVIECFVDQYAPEKKGLFRNYLEAVMEYVANEGAVDEKKERIMRQIEEIIGISEAEKKKWRFEMSAKKGSLDIKDQFEIKKYPKIEEAIDKKVMADVKGTINLTLVSENIDEKTEQSKHRSALIRKLIQEKGYCEHCAKKAIDLVADEMRKEKS